VRSPLQKLLALVVPVFAALAVMAGPASAAPVDIPTCKGNRIVWPALDMPAADVNGDGTICLPPNGHGKVKDDRS